MPVPSRTSGKKIPSSECFLPIIPLSDSSKININKQKATTQQCFRNSVNMIDLHGCWTLLHAHACARTPPPTHTQVHINHIFKKDYPLTFLLLDSISQLQISYSLSFPLILGIEPGLVYICHQPTTEHIPNSLYFFSLSQTVTKLSGSVLNLLWPRKAPDR